MKRRQFLGLLGVAAAGFSAVLELPRLARSQPYLSEHPVLPGKPFTAWQRGPGGDWISETWAPELEVAAYQRMRFYPVSASKDRRVARVALRRLKAEMACTHARKGARS